MFLIKTFYLLFTFIYNLSLINRVSFCCKVAHLRAMVTKSL